MEKNKLQTCCRLKIKILTKPEFPEYILKFIRQEYTAFEILDLPMSKINFIITDIFEVIALEASKLIKINK